MLRLAAFLSALLVCSAFSAASTCVRVSSAWFRRKTMAELVRVLALSRL